MSFDRVTELRTLQAGVLSRQQAIEAGMQPHDLCRLVRRRELSRVHDGVYVDHTGELTWLQQAWAAVLSAWPAALCDESALRAADGPGRGSAPGTIHVGVARDRSLAAPPGVRLHRVAHVGEWVLWNTAPPRMRPEHAVLRVASRALGDFEAIRALSDAVQSRRTTADRLLSALEGLDRLPRRRFLATVLADLAVGACSVLEHGYLVRVERRHGLPGASRQVRGSSRGPVYRDVVYVRHRLVVELDGRMFHDSAGARHADHDRDLDAMLSGLATVRLGWGQVFGTPCRTARRLARLLAMRGWTGSLRRCPDCS